MNDAIDKLIDAASHWVHCAEGAARNLYDALERENLWHARETFYAEIRTAGATLVSVTNALQEAAEFIEGYVDVVDGDYGIPAPNRAMSLMQTINEALRVAGIE